MAGYSLSKDIHSNFEIAKVFNLVLREAEKITQDKGIMLSEGWRPHHHFLRTSLILGATTREGILRAIGQGFPILPKVVALNKVGVAYQVPRIEDGPRRHSRRLKPIHKVVFGMLLGPLGDVLVESFLVGIPGRRVSKLRKSGPRRIA
jgi:hypothetical protein